MRITSIKKFMFLFVHILLIYKSSWSIYLLYKIVKFIYNMKFFIITQKFTHEIGLFRSRGI